MAFLKNTKTVDTIMSAFAKTISELEAVQQSSAEAAASKRDEAARLMALAQEDTTESQRAKGVADKLRGILA